MTSPAAETSPTTTATAATATTPMSAGTSVPVPTVKRYTQQLTTKVEEHLDVMTNESEEALEGRRVVRMRVRRMDPWSVLWSSFIGSILLGIVLMIAAWVLTVVLTKVGAFESVNHLFATLNPPAPGAPAPKPLLTSDRLLMGALVLSVGLGVLITVGSTLVALLYNLVGLLTGGVELTLGGRKVRRRD